jgi:drug/metabolite transporter (DMT)-like permease
MLALLALVMFSSNIVVTKVAAGKMPLELGFTLAVAVNVICGGGVFLAQVVMGRGPTSIQTSALLLFLLAGAFSTFLGRWFFFRAIDVLGPAKASAFQVSNPMFTVVIAWVFLGEVLSPLNLLAVALTVAGLVMVSYVPGLFASGLGHVRGVGGWGGAGPGAAGTTWKRLAASGTAMALVSASSYAVSNVLRGAAVHRWNEPVLGATLGAFVGMVLHLAAHGKVRTAWRRILDSPPNGLALYAVIGVLTISAQACSIGSMRYIPVSISNLITMATPILVTPASYFLLKNQEQIRLLTVLGIALVLAGIAMLVLL